MESCIWIATLLLAVSCGKSAVMGLRLSDGMGYLDHSDGSVEFPGVVSGIEPNDAQAGSFLVRAGRGLLADEGEACIWNDNTNTCRASLDYLNQLDRETSSTSEFYVRWQDYMACFRPVCSGGDLCKPQTYLNNSVPTVGCFQVNADASGVELTVMQEYLAFHYRTCTGPSIAATATSGCGLDDCTTCNAAWRAIYQLVGCKSCLVDMDAFDQQNQVCAAAKDKSACEGAANGAAKKFVQTGFAGVIVPKEKSNSAALIAGLSAAGAALLILCVAAIFWRKRKRDRKRDRPTLGGNSIMGVKTPLPSAASAGERSMDPGGSDGAADAGATLRTSASRGPGGVAPAGVAGSGTSPFVWKVSSTDVTLRSMHSASPPNEYVSPDAPGSAAIAGNSGDQVGGVNELQVYNGSPTRHQPPLELDFLKGINGVHAFLDYIIFQKGGFLPGQVYKLDADAQRKEGGQAVVVMVNGTFGGRWAIKFFAKHENYLQEHEIYRLLPQSLDVGDTKSRPFIRDVKDNRGVFMPNGLPVPSYIVMERGDSMQSWIRTRKPPPLMAVWMLGEICSQLSIMHKAGFVHRDLKPSNILWLQDYNTWRLIDFGSSAREGETCKPSFTWHFAAPEVIRGLERNGSPPGIVASPATDVWAVGVMAFELMSGEYFYPERAPHDLIKSMLLGHTKFPHEEDPSVWTRIGRLKSTIMKMLDRDPLQRPSMSDISYAFNSITMNTRTKQTETEPSVTQPSVAPSACLQSLQSDMTALVDSMGNKAVSQPL